MMLGADQRYRVLTDYFGTPQKKFEEQAQAEKEEWARRSQNVSGLAQRIPQAGLIPRRSVPILDL